jgi:hypothetical protein
VLTEQAISKAAAAIPRSPSRDPAPRSEPAPWRRDLQIPASIQLVCQINRSAPALPFGLQSQIGQIHRQIDGQLNRIARPPCDGGETDSSRVQRILYKLLDRLPG